jgi:hypothetical protein
MRTIYVTAQPAPTAGAVESADSGTAHNQRQETLDLPYLTLLCDNLKNRMNSSKTFFPDPILGICYVFPVIHIIPLFHSQTISLGTVE